MAAWHFLPNAKRLCWTTSVTTLMHHFANICLPGNTPPERNVSLELVLHSEQDPVSLEIEDLELEQLQIHAYSQCITRLVLAEGP